MNSVITFRLDTPHTSRFRPLQHSQYGTSLAVPQNDLLHSKPGSHFWSIARSINGCGWWVGTCYVSLVCCQAICLPHQYILLVRRLSLLVRANVSVDRLLYSWMPMTLLYKWPFVQHFCRSQSNRTIHQSIIIMSQPATNDPDPEDTQEYTSPPPKVKKTKYILRGCRTCN